MRFRPLGRTGLQVSVLAYGASPLGGVFGPIDESAGIDCVRRALDLGINYIDVAPYYGLTRAETVLGKALRGIPRDRYLLATKVGRYGKDPSDCDPSARRVIASVDESLARLGVDYVDVIQCHDIEFVSLDRIVEETLPALRRVRDAGKARFIGITGLPLTAFRYVLDRTEVDTVLSYCHYTLNDRSLEHFVPYLKSKGVGIINASPLAMGLLTHGGCPTGTPRAPRSRRPAGAPPSTASAAAPTSPGSPSSSPSPIRTWPRRSWGPPTPGRSSRTSGGSRNRSTASCWRRSSRSSSRCGTAPGSRASRRTIPSA